MLINFLNGLAIFGIGLLGILFVASVQVQAVNELNPNLNFKSALKLFFSKATGSVITSILGILLYAILRKEVANVFISGKPTPSLVDKILGMQMLWASW